jgi:hypothetical protein
MDHKDSVYTTYRSSLRAQRKNDGGRGRTGARKQNALKVAADRYGIPISKVKAIVRELDAANGITHEHPETYKFELAFMAIFQEAKARLGESPCVVCDVEYSSGLVRPRFPRKVDVGEGWMEELLTHKGLTVERFNGLPKQEDFFQLCSQCKIQSLTIESDKRKVA